jgi:hypothetical protein
VAFPGAPVVLISIDTLRSDRLPAYGYGGVETPHLDRLRRDAILFESAWSPCPMTLPSHVTMLTGLCWKRSATRLRRHAIGGDAVASRPAGTASRVRRCGRGDQRLALAPACSNRTLYSP